MIALVTCYFQHNFGSMLQAFATQELFDAIGIENETICIDGIQKEITQRKLHYFLSRIFDYHTITDKMGTVGKAIAKRIHRNTLRENLALRDSRFREFARTKFRLSSTYTSPQALVEAASSYQAFVVGSDQLWLPSNIEADYYTLNFVDDSIPKISLSTSFGVETLPTEQSKKAKLFLSRFRDISVREQSGKQLVQKLTGRTPQIICDPTLFFSAEEWMTHVSPKRRNNKPYIFCYFLGNNPTPRHFAYDLRKETGLRIVQIQHCDCYVPADEALADEAPYDTSPFDFIRLIHDAEYVLTDSFHATCFSLLFEKQFFTFRRYRKESPVSTNRRLDSLLKSVGAESRIISNYEKEMFTYISVPFDFSYATQALTDMRRESLEWVHQHFHSFKS